MRSEIVFASAWELAQGIRFRYISSLDVVEAYLQQIAAHNPALNAIATLNAQAAREQARLADSARLQNKPIGPLHGVPITVKDTLETAGMRTTAGHPALADYVPAQDATVVARLKEAGAIVLGKSNAPPLAMDIQTDNPLFGRTNNPWNWQTTPGGSSGGAAAALAAGMTALEIGSDMGGSIRLPAHFCGVAGLKPTEHLVPHTGHIPPLPHAPDTLRHMGVVGPMARSVTDLRLALSIIAGPDGRSWDVPPVPLGEAERRPLNELRIAWTDSFPGIPASAETRAALGSLAQGLETAGCRVEQLLPSGFNFERAWETFAQLMRVMVPELQEPDTLGPFFGEYILALERRDALTAAMERFLAEWDAWLCPVAPTPAFPHCPRGSPLSVDGREIGYWNMGDYCTIFNLTGHPALSLPFALSSEGLPIGVQLVGRRWGDTHLLMVGELLEEALGSRPRPLGF